MLPRTLGRGSADVESLHAALSSLHLRLLSKPPPALRLRRLCCGGMAPLLRSAVVRFDALPEPVLRILFLALPVDERARAACVCRGWRAFLADASLWQVLDLTPAGGVVAGRVTENLVRGAVARAAGSLRIFSFDCEAILNVHTVIAVVESNGAALQQLTTDFVLNARAVDALFAAAPLLQVLNACVQDEATALLPLVRNDPPYGPLRLSKLVIWLPRTQVVAAADMLALTAAVAAQQSLKGLTLVNVRPARWLNTLVDAAAERRVSQLQISACVLDGETVPALARLLQRGSLIKLKVFCDAFPSAHLPVLCAALRTSHALTLLKLRFNPQNGATSGAVAELLDAAAALPALSELDLDYSRLQDRAAAGRALGALLAANLPSLRILSVNGCQLGDEGMGPLLAGLVANTHLRELDWSRGGGDDLSEAFVRDRLTPALAALAARTELDA